MQQRLRIVGRLRPVNLDLAKDGDRVNVTWRFW
jgi:hypothetical protein